jgi:glyoxylase-like metal-dependent hydrolase (beta-lactamase superfamily II)
MAVEQGLESHSRVHRVLAPNPSPMTLEGTNSYLVLGDGEALAIDPGPVLPGHISALVAAAAARECRITAIAVTHGHPDHAPGAALLAELTGAPVYAHAAARFPHDRVLRDGETITVAGATVAAFDTPGHAPDHLAFWLAPEAALFAGDVILGRGTTLIAPPDGDMRVYQATLRRLKRDFARARVIYGGHGEQIPAPLEKFDEYLTHREARERQIVAVLERGESSVAEIVALLYPDLMPAMTWGAELQVLAYLVALEREGAVRRTREPGATTDRYALIS